MKAKKIVSNIGYGVALGVSGIVTVAGKLTFGILGSGMKQVDYSEKFPNLTKMVIDSHNEKKQLRDMELYKDDIINEVGRDAYDYCKTSMKKEQKKHSEDNINKVCGSIVDLINDADEYVNRT